MPKDVFALSMRDSIFYILLQSNLSLHIKVNVIILNHKNVICLMVSNLILYHSLSLHVRINGPSFSLENIN
jgi:hypothetical protein